MYVDELALYIKLVHEEVMSKLEVSDRKNKRRYDELNDMVDKFVPGGLVLVKNRVTGVFEPTPLGPYEVVRYKDKDRYVVELMDS